jgi:hypothetical protein
MKKLQFALSKPLPILVLAAVLSFASQPGLAFAQSDANSSANSTTQERPMQPDNENAASAKTFSGKIVKSGDKFVLTDADSKTIYQLDDQQKAQSFLNKIVKVTGVLDPSTGTIRVSAIEPV